MNSPESTGLVLLKTSDTRQHINIRSAGLRRMKRGVFHSAKCIESEFQQRHTRYRSALITFTYRAGDEWSPLHITESIKCYRQWARRRGFRLYYVWCLELTKAGIPHYHLVLWLPRGITPPLPDKQGWWKHGMTNAKWARSPVGYIAKYASKGTYGELPASARLWATGGLTGVHYALKTWLMAPRWLRDMCEIGNKIIRKSEGWWLDVNSQIRYRSPWVVDSFTEDFLNLRWVGHTIEDVQFLYADGTPV